MAIIVDKDHVYHDTDNGLEYRSVTTILDRVGVKREIEPGRFVWNPIGGSFGKDDEIAAQFGTAFHAVVGFDCRGEACEYDPAMEPWVRNYRAFREVWPLGEVVACEVPMVHDRLGYAGTPDLVEYRGKTLCIWDWKTGATFQRHWKLQLAAYRELVLYNYSLPRSTKTELRTVRFTDKKWFPPDNCNNIATGNQWRSIMNVYSMVA